MNTKEKFSLNIIKHDNDTKLEIEGVLPKADISSLREEVLMNIAKNKKVDGFRDGNVPENLAIQEVEKSLGGLKIWEESAKELIFKNFAEIVAETQTAPIGRPDLQIKALVENEDVKFSLTFYVLKPFNLPNFEEILKDVKKPGTNFDVTQEEVDTVLKDLKKNIAMRDKKEYKDEPLTEAEVKEIAKDCNNVKDLEEQIKTSIKTEKEIQERGKIRNEIIEKIITNLEIDIPEILIAEETERSYSQFEMQAKTMNTTVENFLETQNLTKEELMNRFKNESIKRAKTQLVLNKLAMENTITPDEAMVKSEVDRLVAKEKGENKEQIEVYVQTVLTNEKVMQYLESLIK